MEVGVIVFLVVVHEGEVIVFLVVVHGGEVIVFLVVVHEGEVIVFLVVVHGGGGHSVLGCCVVPYELLDRSNNFNLFWDEFEYRHQRFYTRVLLKENCIRYPLCYM
jgi:hypothetical protein